MTKPTYKYVNPRTWVTNIKRLAIAMTLLESYTRREYSLTIKTGGTQRSLAASPAGINLAALDLEIVSSQQIQSIAAHYDLWGDWRQCADRMILEAEAISMKEQSAHDLAALQEARLRIMMTVDREDKPPYAGQCPTCNYPIYSKPSSQAATCDKCGTEINMHILRRKQSQELYRLHITAAPTRAAGIISSLTGIQITPSKIRHWKDRGQIITSPTSEAGVYEWNIGTIIRMIERKTSHATAK